MVEPVLVTEGHGLFLPDEVPEDLGEGPVVGVETPRHFKDGTPGGVIIDSLLPGSPLQHGAGEL